MHTTAPSAVHADEEYTLPGLEALLAGTLALMTGLAQAAPGGAHREPMTRKVVDNLGLLAEHAQLSAPMRMMLRRLIGHWQPAARPAPAQESALPSGALWAPTPPGVQ